MYIARILYPVEVLGPGKRIGIWFSGCEHRCRGCSNPELWQVQGGQEISLEKLMCLIHKIADENPVDGFTLTGGDPFFQYEELKKLLPRLGEISGDILVYTGYTKKELEGKSLEGIAVLIDGRYKEELNDNSLLRGSSNQEIHILNKDYGKLYEELLKTAQNRIQNFNTPDGFVSVGIHRPGFKG